MTTPTPTYQCATCRAHLARDQVYAAAGPTGAAWYCTDADTHRARAEGARGGRDGSTIGEVDPRCSTCDGTGVSSMTWAGPNREDWVMNICTDCEGTGR